MGGLSSFWEGLVTIALAIVGLAIVATLVSKNAQTGNVIQSSAGGLGEDIEAAVSPVTGGQVNISWPSSFNNMPGS
jgi:hypothetical protein